MPSWMNVLQQDMLADSRQKVILIFLVNIKNKQRDESIHIHATELEEMCSTNPLKFHH
jgi:hypothetical protein